MISNVKPTVAGVGYLNGEKPWKKGQYEYEYLLWSSMLQRCYKDKGSYTYTHCTVSDNFKDYSFFKKWCVNQVGFSCRDEKHALFHLDKDVLCYDVKIYSEETCCFIPAEINCAITTTKHPNATLPSGVSKEGSKFVATLSYYGKIKRIGSFTTIEEAEISWKTAKSAHILELANKWEDKIDIRAYNALINRAKNL